MAITTARKIMIFFIIPTSLCKQLYCCYVAQKQDLYYSARSCFHISKDDTLSICRIRRPRHNPVQRVRMGSSVYSKFTQSYNADKCLRSFSAFDAGNHSSIKESLFFRNHAAVSSYDALLSSIYASAADTPALPVRYFWKNE